MSTFIIADDHHLLRKAVKTMLTSDPRFQVIGEAEDVSVLDELLSDTIPDFLLVDYKMPKGNTSRALERYKKLYPEMKIGVLTGLKSPMLFDQLLKIPVDAIFLKDNDPDEILEGIECSLNGKLFLASEVENTVKNIKNPLSKREYQIMEMVIDGYTSEEIADHYHIAKKTVANHRNNIFEKLGVSTAVELVNLVRDADLDLSRS